MSERHLIGYFCICICSRICKFGKCQQWEWQQRQNSLLLYLYLRICVFVCWFGKCQKWERQQRHNSLLLRNFSTTFCPVRNLRNGQRVTVRGIYRKPRSAFAWLQYRDLGDKSSRSVEKNFKLAGCKYKRERTCTQKLGIASHPSI